MGGLLLAAAGCGGPGRDTGGPGLRLDLALPDACIRLEREALRDLALADSLLVVGQMGVAVEQYRGLAGLYPDCAPVHSRLGDASLLLGRTPQAIAHYETALALDPCDGAARAGIVALRFPDDPRSRARANELRWVLSTGSSTPPPAGTTSTSASSPASSTSCATTPAAAGLAWRLALVAGDSTASHALREALVRTAPFSPALLEYGRNLIADTPPRAILLTGSRLETDVALASGATGPRGVSVIDLELLAHPAYARALRRDGIDFGLSDDALAALAPYWSTDLGRNVGVAETLVRALVSRERTVAVSGAASHPALDALGDRLVVVGLVQRVVRERGGVSPSSVDRAAATWTLEALPTATAIPAPTGSVLEARGERRLLWRYAEVSLAGAQAALRRRDPELGGRLLAATRARVDDVGGSIGLRDRLAEIEALVP